MVGWRPRGLDLQVWLISASTMNLQLLGVMVHEHELHVHGLKHNHFFSSLFTFSVKIKVKLNIILKVNENIKFKLI
jgi:hypothetical protein